MFSTAMTSLSGLPAFFIYFGAASLLLFTFAFIYTHITPYRELTLIRKGNTAAGIAYGGAILGYTLPLASAIANSVSLPDMLIWGAVALLVQLFVLGVVRLIIPDLFKNIVKGKHASAVLLALISLSAGLLNAASMTY